MSDKANVHRPATTPNVSFKLNGQGSDGESSEVTYIVEQPKPVSTSDAIDSKLPAIDEHERIQIADSSADTSPITTIRIGCEVCNDLEKMETGIAHDSVHCCLRCRNYELADRTALRYTREELLKFIQHPTSNRGPIKEKNWLGGVARIITAGLKLDTDKA